MMVNNELTRSQLADLIAKVAEQLKTPSGDNLTNNNINVAGDMLCAWDAFDVFTQELLSYMIEDEKLVPDEVPE